MDISHIMMLVGGLALFLYGMKLMGDSLEAVAGKRLKSILEKLVSNRFKGVLVGTGLTAVIQSSSATTVMVVGFVNVGIMTLSQAVSIVMGANIGTTITGQMIALDIGVIAPLFAITGVVMSMLGGKRSVNLIGHVILGLGILFIGMNMMSDAMTPLRDIPEVREAITSFQNPFVGILIGAAFTAVIQSSSAAIGILQALAVSGLVGLDNAVFVLFGMNIGTCVTSVIASVGANRNAKRVAIVHLLFNVIGTAVFTILCELTPVTDWVASWTPGKAVAQIANMHTLFNVTMTVLLFPFTNQLARLSQMILPVKDYETKSSECKLRFITDADNGIGSTAIRIENLVKEVDRMADIARENVRLAMEAVADGNEKNREQIRDNEECIDYLTAEITRYTTEITAHDMPQSDAEKINTMFRIAGDLERIGDHAENIFEYMDTMTERKMSFVEEERQEICRLYSHIDSEFEKLSGMGGAMQESELLAFVKMEDITDDMTENMRERERKRMTVGETVVGAGLIYCELMSDIERISDHMLNIAQAKAGYISGEEAEPCLP